MEILIHFFPLGSPFHRAPFSVKNTFARTQKYNFINVIFVNCPRIKLGIGDVIDTHQISMPAHNDDLPLSSS